MSDEPFVWLSGPVQNHKVRVTVHAAERYAERLRHNHEPTPLEMKRYYRELITFITEHCHISEERPDWLSEDADYGKGERAHLWIRPRDAIDTIAFPLVQKGDRWYVMTTLTRGGYSPERRNDATRIKSERRRAKRNARAFRSWRGEKAPRWK